MGISTVTDLFETRVKAMMEALHFGEAPEGEKDDPEGRALKAADAHLIRAITEKLAEAQKLVAPATSAGGYTTSALISAKITAYKEVLRLLGEAP